MDYCLIQGESKTLIRLTLQKLSLSASSMGHLDRKGFNDNKKFSSCNQSRIASINYYADVFSTR